MTLGKTVLDGAMQQAQLYRLYQGTMRTAEGGVAICREAAQFDNKVMKVKDGACVHQNVEKIKKKSKTLCDMEMCGYADELAIRRKTTSAAQYSMLLHNAPAVDSPSRLPLQRHLPISIIRQAVTDKKPHSNLTSLIAGVMCSLDVA